MPSTLHRPADSACALLALWQSRGHLAALFRSFWLQRRHAAHAAAPRCPPPPTPPLPSPCASRPSAAQLGPAGQMDPVFARRLFGFTRMESFHDPATDTRVLLAWCQGSVLLAFRGTASSANIATDLKAWQTAVQPRRHHAGRLVKAHAGESGGCRRWGGQLQRRAPWRRCWAAAAMPARGPSS